MVVNGVSFLLDTGTPISVAEHGIRVGGRRFEAHESYLDVCPAWLSDHIGYRVDGLIGADIMSQFTVCIRPPERMVEFSSHVPDGEIVLPLQEFMQMPIIPAMVGGRVLRSLLDTGSTLSLLREGDVQDLRRIDRRKAFHPLVGSFLTDVFQLGTE